MLTLFSQVMVNVKCPYVMYRKGNGFELKWFPLFRLFPVSDSYSICMESFIFLVASFVALGPVDDCDNVGNLFVTDNL